MTKTNPVMPDNAYKLMPSSETARHVLSQRAEHMAKYQIKEDKEGESSRYIRFRLGKEFYGIPYDAAKEIMDDMNITKLPHAPDYIAGVINRRGSLLTIIDFKLFLNVQTITEEKNQYIIVITQQGMTIGILVDNIEGSDAYTVTTLDQPLPSERIIQTQYILGIHKGITAIVNMETIISDIQQKLEKLHAI